MSSVRDAISFRSMEYRQSPSRKESNTHAQGRRRRERGMIARITEKNVTKSIRDLLKTLGVFHFKQFQSLGSVPGVPDIIGIYQGRFLGIEVKAPKGKPSPMQVAFLDNIRKQGGIAILAYSVDDVIKGLGVEDRFLNLGRPMQLNEIPGVKRRPAHLMSELV